MGFNEDPERPGRFGNAIVGGWTFLSAFLISRTTVQRVDVAIVGALVVAIALGSLYRVKWLHWLNIGLGVWLFVSPILFGAQSTWAVVNDMMAASLIFGLAVFPSRPLAAADPRRHSHHHRTR